MTNFREFLELNEVSQPTIKYRPKNYKELAKLVADRNIFLGSIDTSLITDMNGLFSDNSAYVYRGGNPRTDFQGIEHWNVSKVKDMGDMFARAKIFNVDLSKWDVSNVENMSGMFYDTKSFVGTGLSKWNVSKVKDMSKMFAKATNFNENISKWNVKNVKDARDMFDGASRQKEEWCPKFNNDVHQ